jgi:hypothetical protein
MKNHSETLKNPEFVAWLSKPDKVEKYQGVTREKFEEFYTQAKEHAKLIARAIGIETQSIEDDTSDTRLNAMIADGDVYELNGLYWRHEALDDATQEFYKLD